MVVRALIAVLCATALPAWGSVQPRQLCLACHTVHYAERGGCSGCHRGNPASERKNIAHAGLRAGKYIRFTLNDTAFLKKGGQLMDRLACRRCHVSAGRGNRLAVDLDSTAARKPPGELARALRRPAAAMPYFALDEEQATVLVNAIYAGSQGQKAEEAVPIRVHFTSSGASGADIFSKKCGTCHRLLSERLGALGTGDIGPNLSGLLSAYYPKTFRDSAAWNGENLGTWLKNPRKIRPWALMQPVTLTEVEAGELAALLTVRNGAANR